MSESVLGPSGDQWPENLYTLNAISAATVSSLGANTVLRRALGLTCEALDAAIVARVRGFYRPARQVVGTVPDLFVPTRGGRHSKPRRSSSPTQAAASPPR